ncbi:rod shape-determining protein MreD [Shimia sp.]|uniref:rod shape-determining protein MreD n=1 Tax=Shimia sp. TaxID=1954381 RepID=UPI003562B76E
MAEATANTRKWQMRLVYLLLVLAILYLQLLPLQTAPRSWAGPDLILLFTVVWAIRRPEYVPALSVAVVALLADFILMRPPGVMAAILVAARQMLKHQEPGLRDSPFALEWLTAAAALAAILLANRLVLAVFLVEQPALGISLTQLFMNVLAYPLVVLVSRLAMGVRKLRPGETDAVAGAP